MLWDQQSMSRIRDGCFAVGNLENVGQSGPGGLATCLCLLRKQRVAVNMLLGRVAVVSPTMLRQSMKPWHGSLGKSQNANRWWNHKRSSFLESLFFCSSPHFL